VLSNPEEGQFHIYTGGWITFEVPRDLSENFAYFYTDRGLPCPLWQAYENTPEFYDLATRLDEHDFGNLQERHEMMQQGLEWALEDSVRVWLADRTSITPRRAEVSYTSDLYGGIASSWLWPHTLERTGSFTTPLTIGSPNILQEVWNPLNGSEWIYDSMLIRATSDAGTIPDPFTGLPLPHRIESAEVTVQEGLPVTHTLDWVTFNFAPEIVVPDDAWVAWDASTQQFLTAAQVYTQPQTALRRSIVTYPADLFTSVTWHDGSPFSIGDVVLNMILTFDRAHLQSPVYDPSDMWRYEQFMATFRGVRIVSENPLVIETYSDAYELDAERNVDTWWPFYNTGPGAWHNLALGLLADAELQAAFSQHKANDHGIPQLNHIAGPTLDILAGQLAIAREGSYIPYEPTLGGYIDIGGEAGPRWDNLNTWYTQYGHFWLGTGPLYLEEIFPIMGELSLKPNPFYPDAPDRWAAFDEAPIAEVAITGPTIVPKGVAATFDVAVTFQGAPYAIADIEKVQYLLLNAGNNIVFTGEASAIGDGQWQIALTANESSQLLLGANRLEVIVTPRREAVPTFAAHAFETTGLRVLSVTPNSGINTSATAITIGGKQFQTGASVALMRSGSSVPLAATYHAPDFLSATVPADLQPGTYGLRVINPDGERDTLLSAFTVLAPTAPVITSVRPRQGPNDRPVTLDIYGSNFAPDFEAALSSGATYPLQGLYFIDSTHIRAVVPVHIPPGAYDLTVINPSDLFAQFANAYTARDDMDDLYPRANSFWLNPLMLREDSTPTMGVAVRRTGGGATLPSVNVDFSYRSAGGDWIAIGRANTPPLAPYSQTLTLPLEWTDLPAAGTYTLRAVVDPTNAIPETDETNNVITRTVVILPPLADTIPPFVESFRINDGEQRTTQRQVYLNATAQDNPEGVGVAYLLYVEYIFVQSAGHWVPVASSGWVPYAEATSNYPWALHPVPGVHYIRVWAADAAGNISADARMRFINLVPEAKPAPIAADEAHVYRLPMAAGESLEVQLTSISGDMDLYVWGPDGALIDFSDLVEPVEVINFTAPMVGIYQIEVYGWAPGSYTLTILGPVTPHTARSYGIQQQKGRTLPLCLPGFNPEADEEVYGVPSAPLPATRIYLPLVMHN
ncbi:MAG TPA: hypothetical protein ENN19_00275, partial [Chloroflexi bacterium]|nr:hypothetical protein [Chloroflexota bacterium]